MKLFREAALEYAQRGWRVFPLHGIVNGVCTCGRRDCSSAGKHPLVGRGLYEATTDPNQIKSWWRQWRSANVGIATGAVSGIVVIDIDLGYRTNTAFGSLGEEGQGQVPGVWNSLDRVLHKLPRTLTGLTGGGGLHLLYRARSESPLRNRTSSLPGMADLAGIDLRGDGGYVVAPPSVHRSGNAYSWLDASREVSPSPEWLKAEERPAVSTGPAAPATFDGDGTPYGLAALRDEMDRLQAAQMGTRNHELNRAGFAIARLVAGGELLESAARSSLLGVSLAIGLDEPESRQTIDSAFDAGLRQPRVAPHRLRGSTSCLG